MATKQLDVNVTKEAIERNFILLNIALTNYDKQLTALQDSVSTLGEISGTATITTTQLSTLIDERIKIQSDFYMLKSVYDSDHNGKVSAAETVTYIDLTTPPTEGQTLVFNADVNKFQPGASSNEHNVDGGTASSVYLVPQVINGGGAGG